MRRSVGDPTTEQRRLGTCNVGSINGEEICSRLVRRGSTLTIDGASIDLSFAAFDIIRRRPL